MAIETPKTQAEWAPPSWFKSQLADQSAAAYFGHKHNGYQRFRHARLARILDPVKATMARGAMLDVGCATGALTERIRQRYGFARAVGVDFVSEVIEMGRITYPDIEFREATLPDLPFGDAEFDLIVASEVLYYLTPSAQEQALQALARVLKPGGYLLVGAALGGAYFTPEGARALLERQFELVAEDDLRMHAYHAMVSPFYYANRLNSLLANDAAPGSEAMRARYQRLKPVLGIFPFRQLIRGLALLGRPVLGSQWLPAAANALTALGRRSNIALLGRRR